MNTHPLTDFLVVSLDRKALGRVKIHERREADRILAECTTLGEKLRSVEDRITAGDIADAGKDCLSGIWHNETGVWVYWTAGRDSQDPLHRIHSTKVLLQQLAKKFLPSMSHWAKIVEREALRADRSYFLAKRPVGLMTVPCFFQGAGKNGKLCWTQKPGLAHHYSGDARLVEVLGRRPDLCAVAVPADAGKRWKARA